MSVNEESARPDVVLTFVDAHGREWLAAAYLGELESDGQTLSIHNPLVKSVGFAVRRFVVVERE